MGRRRARRRYERARAKRPAHRRMSLQARLGLIALGVLMVAAGVVLLAAGSASPRIPRLAGILIIVGLILAGAALIGAL